MNKSATITIEGIDRSFVCDSGCVLDAAIAHAVPVPYNCRGGACGTCKAEVLEGAVEHGWLMSFAISDEEIAAGRCLICRARPLTEKVVLRMLNRAPSSCVFVPVESSTVVVAADRLSASVMRLTLLLPPHEPLRFNAGMYVELQPQGIDEARPYSILTAPGPDGQAPDRMISLLIARHEHGRVSSYLHESVAVGDQLRVRGPYGTFHLPTAPRGKVLLLAGGTGLAPLLSIARTLLEGGCTEPIELLFSVRRRADVFCLAELEQLAVRHRNFSFGIFITRANEEVLPAGWQRRRITGYLAELETHARFESVLIAGPAGFVNACSAASRALVTSADAILVESYENQTGAMAADSRTPQ